MGKRSAGRTGRQRGWGRFKIEAAIMASIILVPVILVLISLAVPKFTHAKLYMRETGAIQAIKTIQTAENQYQSQCGQYAASLTELGPPASGEPSASAAGLIGNDLANGEKAGYKFTVAPSAGGYTINATPVTYGISGSRSFYSDQTMAILENFGPEPATPQSKELR